MRLIAVKSRSGTCHMHVAAAWGGGALRLFDVRGMVVYSWALMYFLTYDARRGLRCVLMMWLPWSRPYHVPGTCLGVGTCLEAAQVPCFVCQADEILTCECMPSAEDSRVNISAACGVPSHIG
jgi:hypothetical protein